MSEQTQPPIDISPAAILNATQSQRMAMILQGTMTVDKDYLKLLKDADQTAIGQLRIQTDNENAAADREVSMAIAATIGRTNTNPFQQVPNGDLIKDVTPPRLDTPIELPEGTFIDDENIQECNIGSPDLDEMR